VTSTTATIDGNFRKTPSWPLSAGDVDVSLLDTALSMLNYMGTWTLNRDWRPAPHAQGAHQSIVPARRSAPQTVGSSSW